MKRIRRNLSFLILWLIFFAIFIIHSRRDTSFHRVIEKTFNEDQDRLSIIGLRQSLGTRRRNQACLVLNDSTLINIAGYHSHTIEFQDLHTGVIKSVYKKNLNIHHHVALLHHGEIWIPCGLSGNDVDHETSLKHMLIINVKTGNIRRGPKLRRPRGLCGAVIVSQMMINRENIQSIDNDTSQRVDLSTNKWTEDVICILGGSVRQHDAENITSHVECYSERARGWLILSDLPVPLDHPVAHIYNRPFDNQVTARMVRTGWHEDQVLVVVGSRKENDEDDRQEIYTMSLNTGEWILAAKMVEQRVGFASCIFDNRYVAVAGGISERYSEPSMLNIPSAIEICDMRTGKCHVTNARLQTARFDTAGCSTNELFYICGGTTNDTDSLDSCESFLKDELLNLVDR